MLIDSGQTEAVHVKSMVVKRIVEEIHCMIYTLNQNCYSCSSAVIISSLSLLSKYDDDVQLSCLCTYVTWMLIWMVLCVIFKWLVS